NFSVIIPRNSISVIRENFRDGICGFHRAQEREAGFGRAAGCSACQREEVAPFVMSSGIETSLTILRGAPAPNQSNVDSTWRSASLFSARPVFELFFTRNRIQHVCAVLVVNRFPTAVISGET